MIKAVITICTIAAINLIPSAIPKQLNPVEERYLFFSDSVEYYYNKRHCLFVCGKTDSAYVIEKVYWHYLDSVSHYQNILFDPNTPNGKRESKNSCDCN